VEGKFSESVGAEVVEAIVKNLEVFKEKFEKGSKKADQLPNIKNFPMDTVIPIAAIYYMVQGAEIYEVKDNFIMIGYNLYHWKMLTDKQNGMLKQIQQDFYNEANKEGYEAMFQFQIDDNAFNSISSVFTSVDKSFSMRELMKNNPKTKPMVNAMTTNMIAPVIPTFTEEYGENKNLDIMFSLSHSLF